MNDQDDVIRISAEEAHAAPVSIPHAQTHMAPTAFSPAIPRQARKTGLWLLAVVIPIVVVVGGIVAYTTLRTSATRAIERVLQLDAKAGNGASTVSDVVAQMRAIDLSGCPEEFRAAYLGHIHAWEEMVIVEQAFSAYDAESNSAGALVEAFVRGFLGDPLGKMNEDIAARKELQDQYRVARQGVRDTWHVLEKDAVARGAALPRQRQ